MLPEQRPEDARSLRSSQQARDNAKYDPYTTEDLD